MAESLISRLPPPGPPPPGPAHPSARPAARRWPTDRPRPRTTRPCPPRRCWPARRTGRHALSGGDRGEASPRLGESCPAGRARGTRAALGRQRRAGRAGIRADLGQAGARRGQIPPRICHQGERDSRAVLRSCARARALDREMAPVTLKVRDTVTERDGERDGRKSLRCHGLPLTVTLSR